MIDPTTFRWDEDQGVLWAGVRSYPARFTISTTLDAYPSEFIAQHPSYRMEVRSAIVWFENQWCLSTIWGDYAHGSNYTFHHPPPPFIEEPTHVEVGVLVPEGAAITRPGFSYNSQVVGAIEIPERTTTLWGDPLSYVDVTMYHRVADLVMMLPTDIDLPEGEWEDAQGFCDLLVAAGLERTL